MSEPAPPRREAGDPTGRDPAEALAGAAGDLRPDRPEPVAAPASSHSPARARTIAPPAGPIEPDPPAGVVVPPFVAGVRGACPDAVEHVSLWVGDWSLVVAGARLVEVAGHLRDGNGAQFDSCSDVTATDWPPRTPRFDVIYSLYSTRLHHRVRLKVRVADGEAVPSVTGIWPSASWLEREVYDLFGIRFDNHPDLRRILMPDEWQGHPQRKDYPLEGPGELLMENPIDWLRVRRAEEIE